MNQNKLSLINKKHHFNPAKNKLLISTLAN